MQLQTRIGHCGAWSYDTFEEICYLHTAYGCCGQFDKRVSDSDYISGYTCNACWSTRNDCPCGRPNPFPEPKENITEPNPSTKYEIEIKKFHVNSKIQMRYAITDVEAEMQNIHNDTWKAVFDMIIPKEAFVSKFVMVINGKIYEAKVKFQF